MNGDRTMIDMIKRSLALATLLCMCLTAAAETLYAVNGEGFAALIDEGGNAVIEPGIYETIRPLVPSALYAVQRQGEKYGPFALADGSGALLSDFGLDACAPAQDCALCRAGSDWGAFATDGTSLLGLGYTQIATDDGVTFLATQTDPYDDEADVLLKLRSGAPADSTGIRLGGLLEGFSDGRMLYKDADTGLWGYLDADGGTAIAPVYRTARTFSHGLAEAADDDGLGLIDTRGAWVTERRYRFLEHTADFAVGVAEDGSIDVIAPDGSVHALSTDIARAQVRLVGGVIVLRGDGITAICLPDGTTLWQGEGRVHILPGCDRQLVMSFGDTGESTAAILTYDGVMAPTTFESLIPLTDGVYATVSCDIEPYHSETLEADRVTIDQTSYRYGLMSAGLEEILPCDALSAQAVGEGAFLMRYEDEWRLVDETGEEIWKGEQ